MERHLEWLNKNTERMYPLQKTTDLLPTDFFLDASFVVDQSFTSNFWISKIYRSNSIISIIIRDSDEKFVCIASGVVNDDLPYNYIEVESVVNANSGVIAIGPGYQDFPLGTTIFDKDQVVLLDSVVNISSGDYLNSLLVGTYELKETIEFIPGDHVSIDADVETNTITFSLISPEEFVSECEVTCNSNKCSPEAIYQLGTVTPDENGNINMNGDGVVVSSVADEMVVFTTPELTVNDFCENRTEPSPGPVGPVGPIGPVGPDGVVICGLYDCECALCDVESGLEDCENIILQE